MILLKKCNTKFCPNKKNTYLTKDDVLFNFRLSFVGVKLLTKSNFETEKWIIFLSIEDVIRSLNELPFDVNKTY